MIKQQTLYELKFLSNPLNLFFMKTKTECIYGFLCDVML